METYHVTDVRVSGDYLVATINDKEYRWLFSNISGPLADATDAQRRDFRIALSGYGIHWPQVDEDLSIGGLMRCQG
jgi:hypothetical protein